MKKLSKGVFSFKELHDEATAKLTKIFGLLQAKQEANYLIMLAFNLSKADLFLADSSDDQKALLKFNSFLTKRLDEIPFAYLAGVKEFYGREFFVNRDVLIPRPESEDLIELAKKCFFNSKDLNILDLGTGSGALLITLVKELAVKKALGVDISHKALEVAKANIKKHKIKSNCYLLNANWVDALTDKAKFDLIIVNPPYVESDFIANSPSLLHEPIGALDGGKDGLAEYQKLALCLKKYLKNQESRLIMEIGKGRLKEIIDIFQAADFSYISHNKIQKESKYKDILPFSPKGEEFSAVFKK